MAYLEIGGVIISPTDIAGVEERRVVVKVPVQTNNPEPKPQKGFLAKLMYSDTIEKTVELEYTVIELKVKGVTQIISKVDEDTGAISNRSNQTYNFYAVCNDREFVDAMSRASNKKEVELEIGNFYCYPGMLAYSDYLTSNVIIDEDIESKEDFIAKYINNLPVKKESKEEAGKKQTLHAAIKAAKNEASQTDPETNMITGNKFDCEIVTFTKSAGGRHAPFFTNYMPTLSFGTSSPKLAGTITLPADMECCNPGDNARVVIEVEKTIRINKGARFNISENGKIIGFGTIIDIAE